MIGTSNDLRETWGLTSENLRLFHNPKTTRDGPHFHPYKTYPPDTIKRTITTALLTPNHNFGKDEYVVDITGHVIETWYWEETESGLLGGFEFKGAYTVADGSCDDDSRSMWEGFCNVEREDEWVSSNRPHLVALTECLDSHEGNISLLYLADSSETLQVIWLSVDRNSTSPNLKSPEDVLKKLYSNCKHEKRVQVGIRLY